MQDLTLALVQANQIWEDKQANWDHYMALLSGFNEPVDLIVLPEMFDTGFSMNTSLAEEWGDTNSSLQFLKRISKNNNAAVYTSLMCKEKADFYNRGVFVYPNGRISHYDKRKTFGLAGENLVYTAGKEEKIIEFKGWKILLQICYDLRFPELCRNRIINGKLAAYDLLLYVANWPERRNSHWKTLLQARAIENQCYVIGVNRVGMDGGNLSYSGDSVCVTALGETEWCERSIETIKLVTLSNLSLENIRFNLPFLKDR
jgi:omega-amidase